MGVVHEAYDSERRQLVALKKLLIVDPAAIYRLKKEFRSLADLAHPNLISLYELINEDDEWFFTMELVEGLDFISYVRPSFVAAAQEATLRHTAPDLERKARKDSDQGRTIVRTVQDADPVPDRMPCLAQLDLLRSVLRQLTDGVAAVHKAGKLHRDLKPSNVLVTPQGRAVVLDFGVVADLTPDRRQTLAGTPQYMAPEQISDHPATAATDWYALGVMLYEALTGRLPYSGDNFYALAMQKQSTDPPPPASVVSGVPDDLNSLCVDLLHRDPAQRPSAAEILRRLGGPSLRVTAPSTPGTEEIPFVGRAAQLRVLHESAAFSRGGQRPVAVLVHGRSGLGKTALVRHFLDSLRARDRSAVVLNGRCYEHESVPFKALDSLIDDLMQHLRKLNSLEVKAVLPTDTAAMARLFPVLEEIEAVKKARLKAPPIRDSQEVRSRAFAALREMAARISDDRTLVLFLDDLQWGDRDSAQLVGELLRPPQAPALLLIGTYRPEEAEESPFLTEFRKLRDDRAFGDVRELGIEELQPEEAEDLARAVAGGSASAERIEAIAREAAGSPFFIQELARSAEAGAGDSEDIITSLDDVIRARVRRLPEPAQHLLEVVAVAGQPLAAGPAIAAAGIDEDAHPFVAALRAEKLVRTRFRGGEEVLVTYHDRVREAVIDSLDPMQRKDCHLRLALALECCGGDAEVLSTHFDRAGQPERASAYAFVAAETAANALAFDHAARLYRFAIDIIGIDHVPVERVIQLAETLGNAGRAAEAAHYFLLGVPAVDEKRALDLRRRASEHLLRSGHVDEGLRIMKDVLASVGMQLPATPRRAVLGYLARHLLLKLRGMKYKERTPPELPPDLAMKVDVAWGVTIGLARIDYIRSAYFQSIQLLLALKLGDPYRVARALGIEAGMASVAGRPSMRQAAVLLEKTDRLCRQIGHPHLLGLSKLCRSTAFYFAGQFRPAVREAEESEKIFRDQCTGVSWEIDTSQIYSVFSLEYLGNLRELATRIPLLQRQAEERGDLYHVIHFAGRPNILWLAQDDPDLAQRSLESVAANRPRESGFEKTFHFPQFVDLFARSQIDIYCGRGVESWERAREIRPEMARWMARVQLVRVEVLHLHARCGLAAAAETGDKQTLAAVQRDVKRILSERMPWSQPLAESLQAGVYAIQGRVEQSRELFESAVRNFEKAEMALFAAAARRRLGEITGGETGRAMISEADEWMWSQGVKYPERLTRVLTP
ncbi:MAG: eukaryotic-like serine/threonine-protein kinase [Thermoanaerobaculia bacterium]|jgi:serine/threonine protein kinase|nr:eukaryotic-like serine/threonine-protein kinase [Thermoanaerobaculia bacterium]